MVREAFAGLVGHDVVVLLDLYVAYFKGYKLLAELIRLILLVQVYLYFLFEKELIDVEILVEMLLYLVNDSVIGLKDVYDLEVDLLQ